MVNVDERVVMEHLDVYVYRNQSAVNNIDDFAVTPGIGIISGLSQSCGNHDYHHTCDG